MQELNTMASTYKTGLELSIDEDEFNRLYPDLVGHYDFYNLPPPIGLSSQEFERKYLTSKLWRLNNIYTVINKKGKPVRFKLNPAQHKVYAASRKHPRVVILKSRQQGISTFWLVSYFDDGVFCPFLNIGLMAQGTDEAATLLERAKFLWATLDDDIKAFIGTNNDKDNTKKYSFTNDSAIFIRVSFRSSTLQRLHVSEFGKIANAYPRRAKEVKTGTLQALGEGMTGVIESTAEGLNMFKTLWDDAMVAHHSGQATWKDFHPVFLSWLDDPDCNQEVDQEIDEEAALYFDELETKTGHILTRKQKNFWVTQRRELGGDIFQEYPATPEEAFTASRDGTYYSKLFSEFVTRRGRIRSGLYDPNLPVDVYFDLGVDDYFVMVYTQWYRGEWYIIDEYWNNGYGLRHYLEHVEDSKYVQQIRALRFPHDIKVREQGNSDSVGRAKSRYKVVQEWCIANGYRHWRLDVLPRVGIETGIEAVRSIIPHMYIDESCTYIISCFQNYSKEWDEKLQVWRVTPLHDEFSHGADAVRQMGACTIENSGSHQSKLGAVERSQTSGVAL